MKLKKLTALVLLLSLCLALAACGAEESPVSDAPAADDGLVDYTVEGVGTFRLPEGFEMETGSTTEPGPPGPRRRCPATPPPPPRRGRGRAPRRPPARPPAQRHPAAGPQEHRDQPQRRGLSTAIHPPGQADPDQMSFIVGDAAGRRLIESARPDPANSFFPAF